MFSRQEETTSPTNVAEKSLLTEAYNKMQAAVAGNVCIVSKQKGARQYGPYGTVVVEHTVDTGGLKCREVACFHFV